MTFRRCGSARCAGRQGRGDRARSGTSVLDLVYAVPYGLLALVAGVLLGHAALGAAVLGWSVLNRCIEALVIGWDIARDPERLRRPWLYTVRDLLGFAVWVASYLRGKITWRGGRFELNKDGRALRTR